METEAVENYVERSQQVIETSPQMNEENTKVKLVQPLLRLLGWDLVSSEVEAEYTVPMASGNTHVDFALLIGDTPVVFVEVKPVRSDLTDDDVRQLKSYMRQELDIDWGILTNGEEFEVLTKSQRQSGGGEVSVVRFDLDDLAENPDQLELLSKESIRTGRADEIAEQVAQANEAIKYLQNHEDDVTESVRTAVSGEVGEVPLDLEEQSREFVQSLTSVLKEQRQFVSEVSPPSTDGPTGEPVSDSESSGELEPLDDRVVGTISREEIEGDPNATVAVFPTRVSGLPFLKENEAWGFVRVGREFDYVGMYVTRDVREVQYFAKVDRIVSPDEADLMRKPSDYKDGAKIAEDKKVILFEKGTLYQLEDPIPFETEFPQGLRYTTLGQFREARTTDDLF